MIAKLRRSLMSTELIASGVRAKINQRLGGWAASPNFKLSDGNSEIKLHSASLEEPEAQIHVLLAVAPAWVHLYLCICKFVNFNKMRGNLYFFSKLVLRLPKCYFLLVCCHNTSSSWWILMPFGTVDLVWFGFDHQTKWTFWANKRELERTWLQ